MKLIQRMRMDYCFCTINIKKNDRQGEQIRHFHQTRLLAGLLIGAALLAQAFFLVNAHAGDAGGQMTVLRTMPSRDTVLVAMNFSGDDAWRVASDASPSGALDSFQGNAGANAASGFGKRRHNAAAPDGAPATAPGGACPCEYPH